MTVTNWKRPAQVKAYVDPQLLAQLERLAREEDRSVASEVRRAIREYIGRAPASSRADASVTS